MKTKAILMGAQEFKASNDCLVIDDKMEVIMQFGKRIWQMGLVLSLIFLAACGGQKEPQPTPIDPAVVFTAAVQTVVAQLTETALAFSPTPEKAATGTPIPPTATSAIVGTPPALNTPVSTPGIGLFTPLPSPGPIGQPTLSGPVCDNAAFVADITVPDGTTMKPGQDFEKVWRIQNTGTCTWDEGYSLVFVYGDPLDGTTYLIQRKADFVAPGQTKDIGIKMTAHLAPGEYGGCWQMKNDRGALFGGAVCVAIKVVK